MSEAPPRRFSYDGSPCAADPDETLLAALVRARGLLLQRSIRYHRPRGPTCGIGQCTGCLVRLNGRPNVRACRTRVTDGDRAETENAWPSVRFDLLGALDFLFPSGIDSLHGFRRPAFATRAYQRVVRRLAGYGAAPDPAAATALARPAEELTTDALVLGAGPSGRAAAAALVAAGVRTLVLDRSLAPLGIDGADARGATTVAFLPPPRPRDARPFSAVAYREPSEGLLVHARTVVVATGAYDAGLLFGSNDRPGILTADGAFALAGPDGAAPFRRAIVFGAGDRARSVVERFGSRIAAVVAPGEVPPDLVRAASDRGIRLYPRSLVLAANGRRRLRSLELQGRAGGPRYTLPGDALVLAHRRLPNASVFFQSGVAMEWHGPAGAYFPRVDDDGGTSVPGLYAVGAVADVRAADSAASGTRAGGRIAGRPSPGSPPARGPTDGRTEFDGYYRELLRTPRAGRWIACACEDVLFDEVETATQRGFRGMEVVKRYTSLGTGLCQGRYCVPDALLLLSILEGRPPNEVGYLTQRPPTFPTPVAALAAMPDPMPAEAP
jgi:sarcosine oxidase, subunit alpha